jgi:hypothetical protein
MPDEADVLIESIIDNDEALWTTTTKAWADVDTEGGNKPCLVLQPTDIQICYEDTKLCVFNGVIQEEMTASEIEELKWKGEMVEWGDIYCPMLGKQVMTYYPKGTPAYDTVTDPFVDPDGEVCYYKYDHDEGCWYDEMFYLCSKEEFDNAAETGLC